MLEINKERELGVSMPSMRVYCMFYGCEKERLGIPHNNMQGMFAACVALGFASKGLSLQKFAEQTRSKQSTYRADENQAEHWRGLREICSLCVCIFFQRY